MTEFKRVKVKETGAVITIDAVNVNDTVEVLEDVASPALPEPKTSPKAKAASGGSDAGDAGTKKESK